MKRHMPLMTEPPQTGTPPNTSTARRGLPAPCLPCQSCVPFRAQFTAARFLESTHAKVSFLLHHLLLPKESKCRLKTTDHCHSMPTKRKHRSLEIHAEVATATVPQPNSRHQPLNASMLQRFPRQGGLPCSVIGILSTENTVWAPTAPFISLLPAI